MKRATKKRIPKPKPKPEVKSHRVKAWPETFDPIQNSGCRVDVRFDDRNYCAGDLIQYVRYDQNARKETGEELSFRIAFVLNNGKWVAGDKLPGSGLRAGFVVLQLADI